MGVTEDKDAGLWLLPEWQWGGLRRGGEETVGVTVRDDARGRHSVR